jgi:RNA polymerase sigma-70 factor (ECF subfamily)
VSADDGFEDFYRQELARVRRAVFLMCGDAQVAEDAAQEAFARALARWHRLRSHPVRGGWVTTTAMNVGRRHLRRRHTVAVAEVIDDPDTAVAIAIRTAVAALPDRQQEAVALHYLLDLPVNDVAVAMGVDPGTVKTHLSRARASLARALADAENDPTEEYTT